MVLVSIVSSFILYVTSLPTLHFLSFSPLFFCSPVFHLLISIFVFMLYSRAPQWSHFSSWEVAFSNFGAFMCFVLGCGCNMDAKKTLLRVSSLRAFKQHVDSCFQDLSDKEVQRKRYNNFTIHDFGKCLIPTSQSLPLSAMFQHHMTINEFRCIHVFPSIIVICSWFNKFCSLCFLQSCPCSLSFSLFYSFLLSFLDLPKPDFIGFCHLPLWVSTYAIKGAICKKFI